MHPVHWLASWPKSGNTWVRMMLAGYNRGVVDINAPLEITALDIQRYAYTVVSPKPLGQLGTTESLMLRGAALCHLSVRHPVAPVLLKTHNANVKVDGIDLIPECMTAGAIYLVRDPRDLVISYAEHMGSSIEGATWVMDCPSATLNDNGTGLKHFLTQWTNHVTSWLDQATFPVLLVRYEDLQEDPKGWLRTIVRHLGMEPNEERLDWGVELARFSYLQQQEREKGFCEASPQTEQFFKRGTSGHWREHLTEGQVHRIEEVCGEGMDRLGYERTY